MADIRVHHIYDFIYALVSEEFRENIYLALDKNGGYCASKEESRKLRELLHSASDDTTIRTVLGKDDICAFCGREKDASFEEACAWNDSVWDCRQMLGEVRPNEILTVSYLKKQYFLYQKYKNKPGWKKIIAESRRQK